MLGSRMDQVCNLARIDLLYEAAQRSAQYQKLEQKDG